MTDWAIKLDGAAPRRVEITEKAAAEARADLPPAAARALRVAADNVRVFHEATRPEDTRLHRDHARRALEAGLAAHRLGRPLCAGRHGAAVLVAADAGGAGGRGRGRAARRRHAAARRTASVHPAMIVAAAEAGLDELWLLGGAQAIAALTFGVELDAGVIAPVDKLFGPGNAYVAEAKRYASSLPGGPAQDMPAGPSELLVIADRDADFEIVAADLLSQAEHDADAQVLLVSDSGTALTEIVRRGRASGGDPAPRRRGPRLAGRGPRHPRGRHGRGLRRGQPLRSRTPVHPGRGRRASGRRRSPPPAPSSSASGRPRRSATTPPGPATSCRPTAGRGRWAASPPPAS